MPSECPLVYDFDAIRSVRSSSQLQNKKIAFYTFSLLSEAFQLHICLQQYKSGLKRKLRNGGDDIITHRKRDSLEPIRENQDCERFGNFLDLELERTFQFRIRLQHYKGGLKQK
ncbi:hypothetical protein AVEN_193443-1 [Araneus ventricosus]|uniref:Uncharacterized protein n=1 Tax=Araneus ventricosus TaxID=182803 RepID=A0A4Y2G7Z8_ARAVE|nr:hypothetical protein AVEN_193443-1 [Araneus ventricosus]